MAAVKMPAAIIGFRPMDIGNPFFPELFGLTKATRPVPMFAFNRFDELKKFPMRNRLVSYHLLSGVWSMACIRLLTISDAVRYP
jgi:hypothetical protein